MAVNSDPVVVCLSMSGLPVAREITGALGGQVHGKAGRVEGADATFDDAPEHLRSLFAAGVPIIGVCAAGILIRSLAPMLADKWAEPPVLAVSDDGASVVPLLGGHRGANALAGRVASATDGAAALTTAGEVALGVVLDAPPPGWVLANPEDAKAAMASLLSGRGARVCGDEAAHAGWLDGLPDGDDVLITCTQEPLSLLAQTGPAHLVYHPKRSVLGVGCARNCSPQEMIGLVDGILTEEKLSPKALKAIATLDLKADEPAMWALAAHLGVPLRLFDAAELEAQTPRSATPSQVVHAEVGTHGVAENAALAAAGPDAGLLRVKVKTAMATAALAKAPQPISELRGRARGRVSLVGIGPGQAAWRTPEASRLVAEAEELVGYSLYIDLLGPLAAGKPRVDFPLGGEEARCRHALERAGEGVDVALICSGDAGIYAMGALVFELLDRGDGPGGVSDAARRVEVISAPGVSALQAAAARAGAPLGHDFCAISLSDLLTPRADILRRVKAAAEGDFVIAFYNPVSKTRRTLLAEARDILLTARPAETPVLLASSLGRPEEELRYRRLDALQVDEVDMLTVVLVGSSQSRLVERGEGARMYTPRGYAKKLEQGDG
ncbi:MAG: precorrin-3B C(17)-methyltransferase [Rhodobacteraceae bacterium]|nr:precorrin-3B C(17)-methyltransferase [Paracoccaceae bacterium]